jgi:anti-anti-sigma regulatory factor
VILDITGIAELDRAVAQALLETLRGVQLLGAQVVLTGIQPRTAHALVQLGVALNGIRTYHTLQAGVAESIPAVRY